MSTLHQRNLESALAAVRASDQARHCTEAQQRKLAETIVEAFARDWPTSGLSSAGAQCDVKSLAVTQPALVRRVPTSDEVAGIITRDIADPRKRMRLARAAEKMDADARVAAVPLTSSLLKCLHQQ